MELKTFFENLTTAFTSSYSKTPEIINRIDSHIDDDTLSIIIHREKAGLIRCVNATVLEIRPDANKKRHMLCQEIWVGYDSEGYHWSDAIRGRLVDCTGLTINQAIDKIVTEVKEMINR